MELAGIGVPALIASLFPKVVIDAHVVGTNLHASRLVTIDPKAANTQNATSLVETNGAVAFCVGF